MRPNIVSGGEAVGGLVEGDVALVIGYVGLGKMGSRLVEGI
jgi:hypothetical protein